LKAENDPVLNDLDSYELIQAGLLHPDVGKPKKKPFAWQQLVNSFSFMQSIRLTITAQTIIKGRKAILSCVSLTRSNPNHDIGFMYAPERLNVLLSRARNGLIMLGNATLSATHGKGRNSGKISSKCSRRINMCTKVSLRDASNILTRPRCFLIQMGFDEYCPDGGCPIPWLVLFRILDQPLTRMSVAVRNLLVVCMVVRKMP
jgi:hypothetical protein